MAAIKLRHRTFWARLRVPQALQAEYNGKSHLEVSLKTGDARQAKALAAIWEGKVRADFQERAGRNGSSDGLRRLYEHLRAKAEGGAFLLHTLERDPDTGEAYEADPVEAGIEWELEKLDEATLGRELDAAEQMRGAALKDALAARQGRKVKRRAELEPSFWEVSQEFMRLWKARHGAKETNTEKQKLATFSLFRGFWEDKPLRSLGAPQAAAFHDALRLLDPNWARSPAAQGLSWAKLQETFGGRARGLSDATVNRHMATLQSLWDWARKRGHCDGDNPFEGFHRRLRQGVNVQGYVAWEIDELKRLLSPPPRRQDLLEVILVGMFSGMRLDEIASLRWGQLRQHGSGARAVHYFQVEDAKTPAGNRQVPVHPRLQWLTSRPRGSERERVWPLFNPEGPGRKPGADAGRDFSRFKQSRGFGKTKAFHSFRKNVTRIMERAGVPENEWAQVFGHERGFTFRVYNPDGITLAHKAKIIGRIAYPGLDLPPVV